MLVANEISKNQYVGDGSATEFAYTFPILDSTHIEVYRQLPTETALDAKLVPAEEYTVEGAGVESGGKVVFKTAPSSGTKLSILRNVPITQLYQYQELDSFPAESHENALAKLTMICQGLDERLDRAIVVSPTDTITPDELRNSIFEASEDAVNSAAAAKDSETAAAESESNAASSASAAASSANAAASSESGAASSASAAATSASAAAASAQNAAESENNAANSAAAILELKIEVSTLSPGEQATGEYDPETGILHLSIPKGDSGASAIATPTSLGSVMPQTGNDDGLELGTDGKLRVRKASVSQRGSVLASITAAANTVPQAGEDGTLDASWRLSGLPLGYIYAWPYSTPMDGSIQINGQLLNRALYADLFTYAKSHGQVISEAEWQEKASQQGGYCNFYSEGDGSTTFRAPKFAPYQKLTMVSADAGKYYEAGLPNITGSFYVQAHGGNDTQPHFFVNSSGALYSTDGTQNAYTASGGSSPLHKESLVNLDASRSSSIYNDSTTVQPESHDWIICAVAFGTATNVGSVDVANVMAAVGQVQSEVEEVKNGLEEIKISGKKVTKKGTRTTNGNWSITGLTVGMPLYILVNKVSSTGLDYGIISGADGNKTDGGGAHFQLGNHTNYAAGGTIVTIPTSTTVVVKINSLDCELVAYQ